MKNPDFIVEFKSQADLFNGIAGMKRIPGIKVSSDISTGNVLGVNYHGSNRSETAEKLADLPGVTKVITPVAKPTL